MNSYFLIPAVAVLINISIWSYVLGQRRKEPVATAFLLLQGDVILWLTIALLCYIPVFKGNEILLLRIGGLFWIPIGVLFLNFSYAVVGKTRDWVIVVGLLLSGIGVLVNGGTLFKEGLGYYDWGFHPVSQPVRHTVLAGGVACFVLYGLLLILTKWRRTDDHVEKKVCTLILTGAVLAGGAALILNVTLNGVVGYIEMIQFNNAALFLFQLMVFFAVTRFRFLSISVENAAEELFEDVQDGILLIDRSGRIRRANKEARRLLGFNLLGRPVSDFFDVNPVWPISRREVTLDTGGQSRVLAISSAASSVRGRQPVRVLAVRDITAQKGADDVVQRSRDELENEVARWTEQLRRAQNMETLGTVAGSIAHDFNNLLAAILGFTHAARNDLPESHPVREDLDEVISAGTRAKDIVRQILSFSRKEENSAHMVLSIDAIVQDAVDLLRVSFPTTIYITLDDMLTDGTVRCDPAEIIQVLMNLGTNALQAMSIRDSGTLRFVLRNQKLTASSSKRELALGKYVVIDVHDSGVGIDEKTMNRIFDPFFTTKDPKEGTGLGLSTALGIVQSHQGTIRVESVVGRGSTFSIWLPLASEASESDVGKEAIAGDERILLLDDDEQLRKVATRMLKPLGYRLRVEQSGMDGIARFEADPYGFDLVITDHAMPNMTGLEVARQIRNIHTDIPIIIMSGYLDHLSHEEMMANGINDFLKKPFTQTLLAERIRRALKTN